MFFDFSGAFITIQPAVLCEKLEKIHMDASAFAWITDYLTNRPHFCETEKVISSTGAPWGTVLSPFLFTLYTSDFQ